MNSLLNMKSQLPIFILLSLCSFPVMAFGPSDAIKTISIDLLFLLPLIFLALWLKKKQKNKPTLLTQTLIESSNITKLGGGTTAQVIKIENQTLLLVTSKSGSISVTPLSLTSINNNTNHENH